MKLDVNISFIDQINNYLKSINKDLNETSIYKWSDDEVNNLVDLLIHNINYGEHTNNSKLHKSLAYDDFAEHILNKKNQLENIIEMSPDKFKNKEPIELNNDLMRLLFAHYIFSCKYCGEEFYVEYKKGGYLQNYQFEETIPDGASKFYKPRTPPKKECYKDKIVKIEIKMKSNKFVIANDLRHMFKDKSINFDDKKYNINTPLGRVKCTEDFADNGIMCISTGNITESIFKNKSGYVFTNMYVPDIEEYYYSEDQKDKYREVNDIIKTEKYKLKDEISCSLRWLMGASDCDLNKDDCIKYDTLYTFQVKKNSTYIIEYEPKNNFYKFYKKELQT